jgi:pteridine reductase
MRIDFTEQVALVTGSARRVGKAIALELARQGADILVHYHNSPEDVVRDTVHEIKSLGVNALSVQADISTEEGVKTVFNGLREHYGKLNILVNSASIFPSGQLMETSLEEWENTLRVNLTGPFLCTKAAVTMMRENQPSGGAIVNIVDKGAVLPWPERAAHGISKAGLHMLTLTSAINFAPDIRVNAVLPGPVLPPPGMSEERWAEIGREQTLLQHTGAAEDVARAVAYLAGEPFVTGTVIEVNGGEHLTNLK